MRRAALAALSLLSVMCSKGAGDENMSATTDACTGSVHTLTDMLRGEGGGGGGRRGRRGRQEG